MAKLEDVINDPNYIKVHNAGFVGLVDNMGTDASVIQAARISYGQGVTRVKEDRTLIRYLLRHDHGTPFEMTAIKFHIKMPIFVMRQWVRHRIGFSINEYSGRYSEMVDEFYMPEDECIQPQSLVNKQGRAGEFTYQDRRFVRGTMGSIFDTCYEKYQTFLNGIHSDNIDNPEMHPALGLAKELARIILPVANYTELYWQGNLRSLFHFLQLRLDPHAQQEIRDFAEAIYKLIQPLYPVCCEAFEDYMRQAKKVSRMEIAALKDLILPMKWVLTETKGIEQVAGSLDEYRVKLENFGMSKREIDEFLSFWITD